MICTKTDWLMTGASTHLNFCPIIDGWIVPCWTPNKCLNRFHCAQLLFSSVIFEAIAWTDFPSNEHVVTPYTNQVEGSMVILTDRWRSGLNIEWWLEVGCWQVNHNDKAHHGYGDHELLSHVYPWQMRIDREWVNECSSMATSVLLTRTRQRMCVHRTCWWEDYSECEWLCALVTSSQYSWLCLSWELHVAE